MEKSVSTIGLINFEDWGFRRYLLNNEIKYPHNILYIAILDVSLNTWWGNGFMKYFKQEVKIPLSSPTGSLSCIRRNIDSDFNLAIWWLHKNHQINLCHYQSIYNTSMGFSTYSTQNLQLKIPPTAFLSKPPNIMFVYLYSIQGE